LKKKHVKKNIKKNKCRVIRSYEAESLTNQMLKDKINKKKSITQNNLKKIRVKKNINYRVTKNLIWYSLCSGS
jgi:hypothetical protein